MPTSYDQHKESFLAYHRANPHIWKRLVKMARQAQAAGLKRIGISLLIETLRWETQVKTRSTDNYKINNNHRAFYAEYLMKKLPEFRGLFKVRERTSKRNSI